MTKNHPSLASKRNNILKYTGFISTLFLAGFAISTPSFAAAEAESEANETIIVVGQHDRPITVVPRGLSVSLNKTDFESVNAINVEDLMKYAPNFFVRKRFAGDDNAVVALRGVNTTQSARTIVMIDGFLVSNFLGNTFSTSPKWNVVGPAEVRQFDIVYGPYSARYGGNSMGGVISVTTQEPQKNSAYLNILANIMPFKEYGLEETFQGYNVEAGANWKQKDGPFSARVSYRHFENIGQPMSYSLLCKPSSSCSPSGTATATTVTGAFPDARLANPVFASASPGDVTQDQLRARLGVQLPGDWTFDLLAMGWLTDQVQDDPRTFLKDASGNSVGSGRVLFDGVTYNANGLSFSKFNRTEYLVGAKLAGTLFGWDNRTNLSRYIMPEWDSYSASNYANGLANGAGSITVQDNPGWYAFDTDFKREFGNQTIAFGLNANLYETKADTYSTTNWREGTGRTFSSASGGKTSSWGIYAEDAIALGESTTLTLGARWDSWRAFDGFLSTVVSSNRVNSSYATRTDSSFSPKASIQAEIMPDTWAQLSIGTATRFPTVGELFQAKFLSNSGTIDPKSFDPNLQPEKSTDISFMLRRQFGPLRMTASLFYQDIENAIVSFTATTPNEDGIFLSGYQNIDLVTQYGLELISEARDLFIDGLDVDFSVTRMDARTIRNIANPSAEGVMVPRVPEWRANGNIRYEITPAIKANLGWRYATRPNSDLFGLSRGDAYGFQTEYFVIDTRVNWEVNDRVKIGFGIDNLNNDQSYVSHPMPQRTFVTDIKFSW